MPKPSPTPTRSRPARSTPKLSPTLERLQQHTSEQRKQTENLMQSEFEQLAKDLRRSAANALSTTESAIQQQAQAFQQKLNRLWKLNALALVLMPLLILIAFSLGAWGLMRYQASQVLTLQAEIRSLEASAQPLRNLRQVQLIEQDGKTFLLLPPESKPWACNKGANQCIELGR